jgi:putative PEP-CTERM system histidine kinase
MLLAAIAASSALALSVILAVRGRANALSRAVAMALAMTGLAEVGAWLGGLTEPVGPLARRLGFAVEFLQPWALFWVATVLLGAPDSDARRRARRRVVAVAVASLACGCLALTAQVLVLGRSAEGAELIKLGPLGRLAYGALVPLLALGISQFESLLRAVRYPARYSLKFLLVGLAIPALYQIFFASQLLLLGVGSAEASPAASLAALAAVGLVFVGLSQKRVAALSAVHVSPEFVYGSVTFLVIGLYLLAVGAVGEAIRRSWPGFGSGLGELVVLLAMAALAVALLSRTAHAELRRFVTRYFYHSKYDYRAKWLEVTEAFAGGPSVDALLDKLLDLLGRTFAAGRISIYQRFEADGRFHPVRSVNSEAPPPPLAEDHPLIEALRSADGPLDLLPKAAGVEPDAFRQATRAVLCAPIRSPAELIAFVALGPESHGEAYGTDDLNLLRAISHHVGVLLTQVRLAEERRNAAELEALHRVSAFCVHDLKNLAARLSLVARNAQTHGHDPAFQESALKTVGRTANEMMDLVHRLSRRSRAPVPEATPLDLNQAIDDTLASMNGAVRATVRREGDRVPFVAATKEEIQQVLLNLLLNAAEAVQEGPPTSLGDAESIVIRTEESGGSVLLTVADRGPGLPPAALQALFQPFRSTKTGGLGLGLYECKQIIESHAGSIRVESEPGKGTKFYVQLPAWPELPGVARPASP